MAHRVYLGLGTNLGDRQENLQAAVKALSPKVIVLRGSPVYETDPWGYTQQPTFLNQVLEVETGLEPLKLLAHVKALETRLGRTPTFHYGPRLIDIDILLYNSLILQTPELVIPHPHLTERAFVLIPLADLAPDLKIPGSERTIGELSNTCDRSSIRPFAY
ncbi:MAG TPA: 2-amino-4-hydroxy-6-hydroxymethyldihydropteridine diphosphokinase [Longilinea sp.]|nr:2-amino-4-hydroxy-6-hydroxymethyldihydropteridine diphosphokinase [Longilinea sp.]